MEKKIVDVRNRTETVSINLLRRLLKFSDKAFNVIIFSRIKIIMGAISGPFADNSFIAIAE